MKYLKRNFSKNTEKMNEKPINLTKPLQFDDYEQQNLTFP